MAVARRRRWGFAVLGLVLIGLVIWAFVASQNKPKPTKTPTVSVNTAKVSEQDIPVSVSALGAAQAWRSVLISAQATGQLTYVAPEGTDVAQGALLAQINSAPYVAALTQAQGALKRDQALLEEARVDLKRFQTLVAQDSIATQQLDTQTALVKQDEGTVKLDEGAVAAAQVNVGYCRIVSPVAGRVGVRLIDPGNIVAVSSTAGIVSVNQITPIAVTFTVPQGDFQRLSDVSNAFTRPLTTQALSQETGADLGSGELSIADNHVDASTGTVQLKARFPNTGKKLWPGQFVNVRLTLQVVQHATIIPAAAVNQGPTGTFAYVVGPDGKAQLRPIVVQTTQDSAAIIRSGLKLGETVVTDGQMTLKPGMAVKQAPVSSPTRKPLA
ncbi:MAG TPA: efflux RND transporter periplasmic adaptor subunit [Caulobacteraceae bacterium]|jgi:multidrug efflux system membrane fusion protein|nr:efflux RND transporter periplasmic adaptor subunit [Caulobacteraceae bacterium]